MAFVEMDFASGGGSMKDWKSGGSLIGSETLLMPSEPYNEVYVLGVIDGLAANTVSAIIPYKVLKDGLVTRMQIGHADGNGILFYINTVSVSINVARWAGSDKKSTTRLYLYYR